MNRLAPSSCALALAAALAGCATADPDVVPRYQVERMSQVWDATVISVRPVTIEGQDSGLGGTTGAIAGGVAGSTVGSGRGSVLAAVVGAVFGGVVGSALERGATREGAAEVIVQLRNGQRRSVVQGDAGERLQVGDPVLLVMNGARIRIVPAPPVLAAEPPPEPVLLPAPTTYPVGRPGPARPAAQ